MEVNEMKNKVYKSEVVFMDSGAPIEFIPNFSGGVKRSYLRIEDKNGNYVGSVQGKVALKNLYRIVGDMLTAYPPKKISKK